MKSNGVNEKGKNVTVSLSGSNGNKKLEKKHRTMEKVDREMSETTRLRF